MRGWHRFSKAAKLCRTPSGVALSPYCVACHGYGAVRPEWKMERQASGPTNAVYASAWVPTLTSIKQIHEARRIAANIAKLAWDFCGRSGQAISGVPAGRQLTFLMTPENYKRESRNWNGLTINLYAISFGDRNIWGATAAIIRNLYERLYQG